MLSEPPLIQYIWYVISHFNDVLQMQIQESRHVECITRQMTYLILNGVYQLLFTARSSLILFVNKKLPFRKEMRMFQIACPCQAMAFCLDI